MPEVAPDAGASTDGTPAGGNTSTATDTFKPITSQDEFNAALGDRLARERSKFADYDDLKTKASQLDELEEAKRSDIEKANGKATKAETERDEAKAEALRLRIANKHGISLEDADLFLTGTTEEALEAQAKRLSDREADRKKTGNRAPREGATTPTTATNDDERAFVRELFGSGG